MKCSPKKCLFEVFFSNKREIIVQLADHGVQSEWCAWMSRDRQCRWCNFLAKQGTVPLNFSEWIHTNLLQPWIKMMSATHNDEIVNRQINVSLYAYYLVLLCEVVKIARPGCLFFVDTQPSTKLCWVASTKGELVAYWDRLDTPEF